MNRSTIAGYTDTGLELKNSRARLEQVMDFLPDPTFAVDILGRISVWNKAMEELTGVESTDMLGKDESVYARLMYGAKRPMLVNLVITPEKAEGQYLFFHKDGDVLIAEGIVTIKNTSLYLWGKASPIYNPEGNIIGAVETIRDISKLKNAQQEIETSEKRYRDIFENVSDLLYLHDLNGNFIETNLAMKHDYGYNNQNFKSSNIRNLIVDKPGQTFDDYMLKVIKNGIDEGIMYIKAKDGDVRIIEYKNSLIYDEQGKASAVRGSARDITARKHAEKALKESEERFRQMARTIPVIFWMISPDFEKINYISPAFEKISGFPCDAVYGRPSLWLEMIHPDDRELIVNSYRRSPKKHIDLEYRIIRNDGSIRWVHTKASPIYDGQEEPILFTGITEDITGEKKAEEERKIYQARLSRAQKMEAIGTLAGGIAHDFNNVLSVIIGYTELAMDDSPTQSPLRGHLQEILKASDRARDLVRQILTFSRGMEIKPRRVKPHLIIKETLKLMRSSIPSTIEIVQHIDPSSGTILADPTQIHQLVVNLCTNAYQAMADQGGVLTVSLLPVELDHNHVQSHHPRLHPGPHIKLSIQDTGCGMDGTIIHRIFDPFFTTREAGRGTGLGLATVHGIVSSLGGEVIVTSSPGEGSIFTVYIPVMETDSQELSHPESDPHRGHGEHILVVDDEEAILQITKTMLENLGYTVSITSSSLEALEMVAANPGAFDLAITDQTMPHMTGDQLARKITGICPALPVILITGYTDIIDEKNGPIKGVTMSLEKPFSRYALADAVFQELHR